MEASWNWFRNQAPRVLELLRAFGQISVGATQGSDAQILNGKAAICRILIAAGLPQQADRYIQNFLQSERSRDAQNIAANLLDDQASRQFWQDARQGAITFAMTELPIMLATSVLSCGTVAAAYATWRVATGIRLSARVLMAAEMVASVPIASIITGQPLDTTASGLLRQAGMMVGSGLAGRVIGRIGGAALARLRLRLPGLQQLPAVNLRSSARFDFGAYLRNLIGAAPSGMIDPHAHHILFKTGNGAGQRALVREGQALLRRYNIDPIYGAENRVWAPNRIRGQHDITALRHVVDTLKAVEAAGGDRADIAAALQRLGRVAADRR